MEGVQSLFQEISAVQTTRKDKSLFGDIDEEFYIHERVKDL